MLIYLAIRRCPVNITEVWKLDEQLPGNGRPAFKGRRLPREPPQTTGRSGRRVVAALGAPGPARLAAEPRQPEMPLTGALLWGTRKNKSMAADQRFGKFTFQFQSRGGGAGPWSRQSHGDLDQPRCRGGRKAGRL